jgi:hypothetical protein
MIIENIYLRKKGFYTRFGQKYQILNRPISYYLHYGIKISKNYTLAHFMKHLMVYEKQIDLIFLAYTRGFKLAPFFKEMQKPVKKDDKTQIIRLEFSWAGQVDNFKEFGEPKYEISEYVHITGKAENDSERYGIGFTSLHKLSEAKLILKKEIEYKYTDFGNRWEEKEPIEIEFFKGVKDFTFENIVGAFLHEISFHGYPKSRKNVASDLKKRAKSSKKEKGIPFEVILLEWAEKDLIRWQNKKDSEHKSLKIDALTKEIEYLKIKLDEMGERKI